MLSTHRTFKQTAILSIIVMFFASVFTVRYYLTRPDPTCFDKEQNQNETGVDCGGICAAECAVTYNPENLSILDTTVVPGGDKDVYDVVAKIHNPNDELGASSFGYTVLLKDAAGGTVGTQSGKGFILPQETKQYLAVSIHAGGAPVRADVSFADMKWQRFSGYQEKPKLSVLGKTYNKLSDGPFFSEAVGNILNDSVYDFRTIVVKVVLRNAAGKAVALNQTEMGALLSKETREFRLKWPKAFPGDVKTIDVEADANIYDSANFVKRYLPGGQYQDLRGKQ